ncbi:hypothetical protein HYH03_008361 [Edaphochlamys debaryana]|uniref:CRAL-TRIO domain-containing protein n=1 Tax=Edaphochlamys debaryana TaxID=47281 RepID=A0A835XYT4_9CHLO|nr:hypothetical protein HYH03_008361 [Edaphochlamys debaryana]|eukprot:KAG2493547.1 hypothetical protein HYH03_008361 [Edaphochlamys debaryana]
MWDAMLAWRRENRVDSINSWFSFKEKADYDRIFPTGLHKTDKEGHPVLYQQLGRVNIGALYKVTNDERIRLAHIADNEHLRRVVFPACSRRVGRPVDQIFTIIDLNGVAFTGMMRTTSLLKMFMAMDSNNYPETLARMCIINAPGWFSTSWGAVKSVLSGETVKKIEILGKDYQAALLRHVSRDNLLAEYGGTSRGTVTENIGPWQDPDALGPPLVPEPPAEPPSPAPSPALESMEEGEEEVGGKGVPLALLRPAVPDVAPDGRGLRDVARRSISPVRPGAAREAAAAGAAGLQQQHPHPTSPQPPAKRLHGEAGPTPAQGGPGPNSSPAPSLSDSCSSEGASGGGMSAPLLSNFAAAPVHSGPGSPPLHLRPLAPVAEAEYELLGGAAEALQEQQRLQQLAGTPTLGYGTRPGSPPLRTGGSATGGPGRSSSRRLSSGGGAPPQAAPGLQPQHTGGALGGLAAGLVAGLQAAAAHVGYHPGAEGQTARTPASAGVTGGSSRGGSFTLGTTSGGLQYRSGGGTGGTGGPPGSAGGGAGAGSAFLTPSAAQHHQLVLAQQQVAGGRTSLQLASLDEAGAMPMASATSAIFSAASALSTTASHVVGAGAANGSGEVDTATSRPSAYSAVAAGPSGGGGDFDDAESVRMSVMSQRSFYSAVSHADGGSTTSGLTSPNDASEHTRRYIHQRELHAAAIASALAATAERRQAAAAAQAAAQSAQPQGPPPRPGPGGVPYVLPPAAQSAFGSYLDQPPSYGPPRSSLPDSGGSNGPASPAGLGAELGHGHSVGHANGVATRFKPGPGHQRTPSREAVEHTAIHVGSEAGGRMSRSGSAAGLHTEDECGGTTGLGGAVRWVGGWFFRRRNYGRLIESEGNGDGAGGGMGGGGRPPGATHGRKPSGGGPYCSLDGPLSSSPSKLLPKGAHLPHHSRGASWDWDQPSPYNDQSYGGSSGPGGPSGGGVGMVLGELGFGRGGERRRLLRAESPGRRKGVSWDDPLHCSCLPCCTIM